MEFNLLIPISICDNDDNSCELRIRITNGKSFINITKSIGIKISYIEIWFLLEFSVVINACESPLLQGYVVGHLR